MLGDFWFVWVVVGAYLLVVALRPAVMFVMLLRQQYRYPKFAVVEPDTVPEPVRVYLMAGAQRLLAWGFEPSCWLQQTDMESSEFAVSHSLVLDHAELGAWATVVAGYMGVGFRINFGAAFEDGGRLESTHGESGMLIGALPDVELVDTDEADVAALWKKFWSRLLELKQSRSVLRQEPAARAAASERSIARAMDVWVEQGLLQPTAQASRFQLPARAALRRTLPMVRASAAFVRFRKARAELEPGCELDAEQIRRYRQLREYAERRHERVGFVTGLLLSGVLFALSMLRVVEPRDLLGLLAVVMFHEFGHFCAMRVLGYRDTSIFFIPFFGAAARGIKRDATIHEQLIVLLAGPLPGLMLAALLPVLVPSLATLPAARAPIDMLISINLINLFPIFPLDGGRIVQLLFSGSRPMIEVLFRAFGALSLLLLGVYVQDAILIALGGLMLVTIPTSKRAASAVQRIRARGPLPSDEDAQLTLLLSELRVNQPSLAPLQRVAVMMPVAQRLRLGTLSSLGTLGWCGTYLTSVVGGIAVFWPAAYAAGGSAPAPSRSEALTCNDATSLRAQLVVAPGAGSFTLHCEIDSASGATLAAALEGFARLPAQGCLIAPWSSVGIDPAQQRARATVVALVAERGRVFRKYLDEHGDADDAAGEIAALAGTQLASVLDQAQRAFSDAHAHDPQFDREVAGQYMNVQGDGLGASARHARDMAPLLDELGRNGVECSDTLLREYTVSLASKAGRTLHGYRDDLRSGLTDLAGYLCAQGCKLRYSVRVASAIAPGDGALH